jgi:AAA family ATP:ADP antiporter
MPSTGKCGALARTWRRFADVRRGEAVGVLLLATNGFLLMMSYYILKTVREPLILQGGGPRIAGSELKTYATAAQALLLAGVVPLYGRFASLVNRPALIRGTLVVLIVSLLIFAGLGHLGLPIGIPYFLWLGLASLVAIAQFWSFANDFFAQEQGERLFPLVAVGGLVGAVFGAGAAGWLLRRLTLMELLLVAVGLLIAQGVTYSAIELLPREPRANDPARRPLGPVGGFELVLKSRYLLFIGVTVLLAGLVNTHGEYILARVVNARAEVLVPASQAGASLRDARRAVVVAFYSDFYGAVNVLALMIQVLVVAPVFRSLGLHRALFVFPLIALAAYGSIVAWPALVIITGAKTMENSTDYSLHNTVRHTLFLPTSRDSKYKAKAAVDTFFLRAGDLLAAATVFAGVHLLALSLRQFAVANVVLIGGWLLVVTVLSRKYRGLVNGEPPA